MDKFNEVIDLEGCAGVCVCVEECFLTLYRCTLCNAIYITVYKSEIVAGTVGKHSQPRGMHQNLQIWS